VGGRSFTSSILQKNCHEFIAYENLIRLPVVTRKAAGKTPAVSTTTQLRDALPPLQRALEVLADREVSPQLGLLKSTLLQLDSTFSERDYGASSFREFIQKMANAGYVHLKQVDRSLIVELKDVEGAASHAAAAAGTPVEAEPEAAPMPPKDATAPPPPQASGAVQAIRRILEQGGARPHWPMYLRSFKHFLRSMDPAFDERRYGFGNIHDLARLLNREGLIRIERNRQGILRIFPGEGYPQTLAEEALPESPVQAEEPGPEVFETAALMPAPVFELTPEAAPQPPPGIVLEESLLEEPSAQASDKPRRRRAASDPSAVKPKRPAPRKPRAPKKAQVAP